MLKFKGPWEYQNDKFKYYQRHLNIYTTIPTVDEVDETLSFMYADTVLQILHGQAIYYGPRVNRSSDDYTVTVPPDPKKDFRARRSYKLIVEAQRREEKFKRQRILFRLKYELAKLDRRLAVWNRRHQDRRN